MIIGNGLIPGILWLITYFTAPKINGTNNKNTSKGVYNVGNNNSDTHINRKIPNITTSNSTGTNYIYHTHINGATSEPLTYNQLQAKNITKDTYVWRNGIDWIKAGDLSELSELFEPNGPPPFDKDKLNNEANNFYGYSDNARIFGISILLFFLCVIIYAILEGMGMVE